MARLWVTVNSFGMNGISVLTFGTVLGKAEGTGTEYHGHITALSISPPYRLLSLATHLTAHLEHVSSSLYKGFFVDLYVRCNNDRAIKIYEGMGYSVYRRVREYYGNLGVGRGGRDEEDAFGKATYLTWLTCVSHYS